ncbi:ribose-5-phosphate isomerase A [Lactiplantibacillus fabifermentans]|uniref:ribose-5-phosphate isomerase n=2 Tax=Lactiplantibacillus fabifermentans TaxID=483011 RepID=A0A0R2NM97_9LACO|nr:ribose-5-phosphate isomerase A [Lactiplantibacillus fabifermentans]ETY73267.1 ribose 5-phosphate isomerase [Lactiplantibacillus fabifermentans T30PCM01]KRO26865.1 ribose 5-phosphate isomerase [Lactiplantibacillus fabifermentans DSM 21115]
MTLALGGGSNVAHLAHALAQRPALDLTIVSPSELTRTTCVQLGLPITNLTASMTIDLAFDGCDSLDTHLNALKSNGGIHSLEKIYAERADQYIILMPLSRLTPTLNADLPLCLEVIEPAVANVQHFVTAAGYQATIRTADQMAGWVRTPNGNLLLDVHASDWSQLSAFNAQVSQQNGVVATSYFKNLVTRAFAFDEAGTVHEIRKDEA